jgi:sulfatase modifying factor 1
MPSHPRDGGEPKKLVKVRSFYLDVDCVTNEQFEDFVSTTDYVTEAELFGWSFLLDSLASSDVKAEVDGKTGYGRVKTAKHWMAVKGANWYHPLGIDTSSEVSFPVVHVSYRDAQEYCSWAGRRYVYIYTYIYVYVYTYI